MSPYYLRYSFNSGDLSTAASRRIPHATMPEDARTSPAVSPSPLYAKFRQSTSPLMSSGAPSNTKTLSEVERRPILPGQSFLQIDDPKHDKHGHTNSNAITSASSKIQSTELEKEVDTRRHGQQLRKPVPSLTIKSGDDP